jgi:hypothetical protein
MADARIEVKVWGIRDEAGMWGACCVLLEVLLMGKCLS